MSKTLWIVGGLIAVIVIVIAVVSKNVPEVAGTPTPSASVAVSATPTPLVSVSATPSASVSKTPTPTLVPAVKVFNISAKPFEFSMKEIKVKKGDTVRILFANTEGTHDWVIDQFKARTPVIQAGKTATVEFVADKSGTFEYYCSVANHRQMGMKGNLVVE